MSYILVGGPDKISVPAFVLFLKPVFPDHWVGEMHSLMSEESMNLYVADFTAQYPNGIISYYAKGAVNKDPVVCLPKAAVEKADAVVWFDLYSNDAKIIKDPNGMLVSIAAGWKNYIQKIS